MALSAVKLSAALSDALADCSPDKAPLSDPSPEILAVMPASFLVSSVMGRRSTAINCDTMALTSRPDPRPGEEILMNHLLELMQKTVRTAPERTIQRSLRQP